MVSISFPRTPIPTPYPPFQWVLVPAYRGVVADQLWW